MDLSFLDKSSHVTPILVKLYDSHKKYGIDDENRVVVRSEMIEAVSNLLDMELNTREVELVTDVLIALMRQAEKDLRAAVAEQLSVKEDVPLRLVLQLANDEIDVASSILLKSPALTNLDLIYIIKSKPPEYWRLIAQRKELHEELIDILADSRDLETAIKLAENMNITLTDHAVSALTDMAQDSDDLAAPLLRRDEVSADIAMRLYNYVGEELKSFIFKNYDIDENLINKVVDDVVTEFVEGAHDNVHMPTAAMLKSADRFREKGLLTINLMLGTLKRAQFQSFVAQFSKFAGYSPDVTLEVLMQKNGQALALTCKAHEVSKADFMSIFLLTARLRSDSKTVDTKDMTRAVQYFDRVDKQTAEKIIRENIQSGELDV